MSSVIWSAMPTPFTDSGELDTESVGQLVQQHERLSVSGLFLGGTCGEGPFMPDEQRGQLLQAVRRAAGNAMHLAVQVSDTSHARVRQNIARAVDWGANSVVIAAPWLRQFVDADFARRYFLGVLDQPVTVPVGIYVLNQPAETGIDSRLWSEVIAHPQVAYVKDSTSSAEVRAAFLEVQCRRSGLVLRTGDEFDVIGAIADGYQGGVLGTAVFNAGILKRAIAAQREGDAQAARAWQERSNRLLWDLFRHDLTAWMPGLKYALRRTGLISSEWSYLGGSLTDEDRRRIDAALEREHAYI